jgi:ABC-type phosphate/phosphonate transport system substrate-binding protein
VLPIPDTIGRYEVLDRLATGGMAEVFVCTERQMAGLERLVVVKRILPHLAVHEPFVEMFLAEARYVARINHPNVVQIFELGEDQGAPFLSMEFVNGVSLRDLLVSAIEAGQPFPMGVAVSLAAQACAGAHAAHELKDAQGKPLGLVHRDISPHNLMVTAEGHVKLLDFGIAKATEAPGFVENTRTGALKGKVHYMAPEQCRQEPLDRRADVFALGIVAWELLAQERLFKRDSELEAMQAIVGGELRDLRRVRRDVPPGVVAAVEKALVVARDGRLPTAEAFKKALFDGVGAGVDTSPEAVAAFVRPLVGSRLETRREGLQRTAHERTGSGSGRRAERTGERARTASGSGPRGSQPSTAPGRVVAPVSSADEDGESTVVDKQPSMSRQTAAQLPAIGASAIDEDPLAGLADHPTVASDRPAQEAVTRERPDVARSPVTGTAATALPIPADAPAVSARSHRRTTVVAVLVASLTCALVTAALLTFFRWRGPPVSGAPLVVSWPPTVEPGQHRRELAQLARVLEQKTGRPVHIELAHNYDEVAARVVDGAAAFGVLPPALFVMTQREHPDIVPLATKMVDGSTSSDGVILVREQARIGAVAELRGRTFCFPDRKSTTGYFLARRAMREAGLDPDVDVKAHYSGNHTQVLEDLTTGVCDAGATYSGGYLAADRAGIPVGRTHQLTLTGRSPQDMIVAGPRTSPADRDLLQRALLSLDPKKDIGEDTLGRLERISGFVAPRLEDYDAIGKALDSP